MNIILERVNLVCKLVRDASQNPTNFKSLIKQIRKTFKKHELDLQIKTKKDKFLDSAEFYVEAFYDSEDDKNHDTSIEVVVHHNFTDVDNFSILQITDFLIQIYDAVVHEYRHQYQSINRNYRTYSAHSATPYALYLSDPDELDAYAMSIAIELLRTIGLYRAKRNLSRISLLAKLKLGGVYASPNLNAYISHFGFGHLTKKLAKKVYKHLETIDRQHIFL
jgi:hypothetical protein